MKYLNASSFTIFKIIWKCENEMNECVFYNSLLNTILWNFNLQKNLWLCHFCSIVKLIFKFENPKNFDWINIIMKHGVLWNNISSDVFYLPHAFTLTCDGLQIFLLTARIYLLHSYRHGNQSNTVYWTY